MPTIMISAANKGFWLGFASRFAHDGWRVLTLCCAPDAAADLAVLAGGSVGRDRIYHLDVAEHDSVDRYAVALKDQSIDILFNNAGNQGPQPQSFGGTDYAAWAEVIRTNVFGVMKMSEAFLEHFARSDRK